MSALWSRIAGLNRVRRAVEAAELLGVGSTHRKDGSPNCALGHGIGGGHPRSMSMQSAADALGISLVDAWAIASGNDCYSTQALRKRGALEAVNRRIMMAARGES